MTTLLQTKAFHRIPPANIQAIFMRMQRVPYRAGDVDHQAGRRGRLLLRRSSAASASVTRETPLNREGIKLAELGVGDTFGEEALISEAKRNATVTMLTDGVLMRLDEGGFPRADERAAAAVGRLRPGRATSWHAADAGSTCACPASTRTWRIDGALNMPLYFIRLKLTTLDREHALRRVLRHRPAQLRRGLHPARARLRCLRAARRPVDAERGCSPGCCSPARPLSRDPTTSCAWPCRRRARRPDSSRSSSASGRDPAR